MFYLIIYFKLYCKLKEKFILPLNIMKEITLIISILLLMSCGGQKEIKNKSSTTINEIVAKQSTPEMISGIKWVLINLNDTNFSMVNYAGGKPWLNINLNDSTINGYTGCNHFGGNISIKTDSLKTGPLMMTKKLCMNIPEPEFTRLLENSNNYVVNGSILKLKQGNTILMTFIKQQE